MARQSGALIAALALLMAGACTGVSDGTAGEVRLPPEAGPVTTLPPVRPDPLQAEVLADGEVTPSEMERALLAVVSCVEAAGFAAELTEFSPADGYAFRTHNEASQDDAASQALDRCQQAFLSEIDEPFRLQHGPTQEEIMAEQEAKRRCLLDRGYDAEVIDGPDMLSHVDMDDLIACDPDLR
jgi:hypothetical protein